MDTDAELLRRYAEAGEQEAFSTFVSRHVGLVYSSALRRTQGNAAWASDAAQAVFVAAAQRASRLSRHTAITAWLYTATRNAAANMMRDQIRREKLSVDIPDSLYENVGTAPPVSWEKIRPAIDAALDRLGERDRHAILLRFFEGHSFSEVGQRLQLTENAARMRVDRALERLRVGLRRRGITSTATAVGVLLGEQSISAVPAGLATRVAAHVFGQVTPAAGALIGGSLFTIMNIKNIVTAGTFVVAAVAGFVAWQQGRQARVAGSDAEALSRNVASLQHENTLLDQRLRAAQKQLADATQKAAAPRVNTGGPGGTARPAANPNAFANPLFAKAFVDKFRADVVLKYQPLYRKLNLPAADREKMQAILIDYEKSLVGLWTEAADRGISIANNTPGQVAVARMTNEPIAARNDNLKELLGSEGFDQFQNFENTKGAYEVVGNLATGLYSTDQPLTAEQGDAVSRLLIANTQRNKVPLTFGTEKPIYKMVDTIDWAAVESQAPALLNPNQVEVLRAVHLQSEADAELQASSRK